MSRNPRGPRMRGNDGTQGGEDRPLVSHHAAVVVLVAALVALLMGGLAVANGAAWPTFVSVALIAFGCTVPAAHRLIGD